MVEDLRTMTDAMARTRLTSVVDLIVSLVALIARADDQIARMATGPRRRLDAAAWRPRWACSPNWSGPWLARRSRSCAPGRPLSTPGWRP